jgi:hypothetical protein
MVIFPTGVQGLADTKFQGAQGQVHRLVGVDFRNEPGIITANQKLTKDSGSTVTELCKVSVPVSDGSTLWFSSESGQIWREVAGVYTLITTLEFPSLNISKFPKGTKFNCTNGNLVSTIKNADNTYTDSNGNMYLPGDNGTLIKVTKNTDNTFTDSNGIRYIPGVNGTYTMVQGTPEVPEPSIFSKKVIISLILVMVILLGIGIFLLIKFKKI